MELGTLKSESRRAASIASRERSQPSVSDHGDDESPRESASTKCSGKGGVVTFVVVSGVALVLASALWLAIIADVASIYRSSGDDVTISMDALTSTVMGFSALYIGILMVFLPPCLRYQISRDCSCCSFQVRGGRLTVLDKIMVLVVAISLLFVISGCVYYTVILRLGLTLLTDPKQYYACFILLGSGVVFGLVILIARGFECLKVSKETNNNEEIEEEDEGVDL